MSRRKRYDNRFKAQVALEAIKNQQTIAQIASEYGVHPNQVSQWKKQALDQLPDLFTNGRSKSTPDTASLVDELYRWTVEGGVGLASKKNATAPLTRSDHWLKSGAVHRLSRGNASYWDCQEARFTTNR